jgi:ketol-acid reductoisomerase
MTRATIHYEEDADLSELDDRTVAMIGYGNQGRAQAQNLCDSGIDVIVGNREDEYRETAIEDGFEAVSIAEAAVRGDVCCLLLPDEVAPAVFEAAVEAGLDAGDTLYVSHGYNLTYDLLRAPEDVDVVLLAPRMGGWAVRERYESGEGFPSLMAVHRDYTGRAKEVALAMAKGIGSTKAGVVETSVDAETITDLLTEQALLPIVMSAMAVKYEIETAYGIPPEVVMTELHLSGEFAEIFAAMAREGYLGQLPEHSMTSQYGQLSRFDAFENEPLADFFEAQLRGIDTGAFAREWSAERSLDRPGLKRLYKKYRDHHFFEAERETMERLNLGEEDGHDEETEEE